MACTEKCDQEGVGGDGREGPGGTQGKHRNTRVPGREGPFDPGEEQARYMVLPPLREEDVAQEGWTAESG